MTRVSGLLLAAGAGRRMGRPKALLRDRTDTPLVVGAVEALRAGGCDDVVVVLTMLQAAVDRTPDPHRAIPVLLNGLFLPEPDRTAGSVHG